MYDNMHKNGIFYALIYNDNDIITGINCILSVMSRGRPGPSNDDIESSDNVGDMKCTPWHNCGPRYHAKKHIIFHRREKGILCL